jgi:hypothetical protein
MKRNPHYQLVILLLGLLFISCTKIPTSDENRLRQTAAETPVHPSFSQVGSTISVKNRTAVLTFDYRSRVSYTEVKDFYTKELNAKGWSGPEEGTYGGGAVGITFRKGEYSVSVYYHEEEGHDWDYAVVYSWGIL